MKTKLCAFLLLMLVTGKSFSQAYIPVLDNASWVVTVYYFGGSQTFTISQSGEQTVGTHTYKKYVRPGTSTEFLLREDVTSRKVYKNVGGNDILFFDFNLNVSDNITLANGENYTVDLITNINVNGGQRRQWHLNNISSAFGFDEVWIEGVGNKEHPLIAKYEMLSDPAYALRCSFQNGENVYNQGLANGGTATDCLALGVFEPDYSASKISFAPNPFQTELMITTEVSLNNSTLKMYNAIGQMVKEIDHLNGNKISLSRGNLTVGLYLIQLIENGKLLKLEKVLIAD
ncbi:T9SS type A sorting domain-containing protein [Flavobacterium sp.]|uniref:T9SS type A sorting domain-containing protein n=1 Tax=Flavobacterium sp. TaxID=239 RepID=UPI00286CA8A5|nr:T9SS type A sorting domain-containing protein [Flavobacterium sp.]